MTTYSPSSFIAVHQCPFVFVEDDFRGGWLKVTCCQRYPIQRRVAATAHELGCPVVAWPIDSPLTLLLCLLDIRLAKVAAAQVWGVTVVARDV